MSESVDWERLSALYDEGSALEGSARTDWLAQLEGADALLRERLARMLGGAASSLTALRQAVAAALPEAASLESGQRLGSWALVEPIGEGGMGQVWRAQRADGLYEAQAAIKLLRADLGSDELQRRFERERKLLGRLQHPGVAQLLDAGIDPEHGAYLVLELVHGQTLDQHVRSKHLPLEQRVRLLLRVAKAVEAAHAQLIVHRDLKPSNVLVGADGFPKLLDFGIATLLDDERGALTRLVGMRLTPAYAAPEQVAGEPISAATDGYSLGVMLYELLTGFLPAGPKASTRTQLEHAVLHREPLRFAELLALPERNEGPGRPPDARRATGDLEAVCAKALRKDPAERYASVGAFVDDLGRWLDAMPVSVRQEDRSHRARLWFRRNRALAVGGLLVLLALAAGLATSLWQRQLAQQSARDAEAVSAYLTELLAAASPDQNGGRQPTVVELLDKKRDEVTTRFEDQPAVKDRIYETLVKTYHALQRFDVAMPMAEERLRLARARFGETDPRTEAAMIALAAIHTAVASGQSVIDLLVPLVKRLDERHGKAAPEAFALRLQLLSAYGRMGMLKQAREELELARISNSQINASKPYERMRFVQFESTLEVLSGELAKAEALLRQTQAHWATAPPAQQRTVLLLERNLAFVVWRRAGESGAAAIARSTELVRRWDALSGRAGNHASALMRQQLAIYLQQLGEGSLALDQLRTAQAETQAAGADDAITGPLRRIQLLEASVLASGAATAESVAAAKQALDTLNQAPLIADVRRAEGLLGIGRVALAPGGAAEGRALAKQVEQALDELQTLLRHAGNLRTRIAMFKARLSNAPDALQLAAQQRTAFFERQADPETLPPWFARVQLACSLQGSGEAFTLALSKAVKARPAQLSQLLRQPHPLDLVLKDLLDGESVSKDCGWQY